MYIRIQVDIAIAGTKKGMDEGETEHGVGKPVQALCVYQNLKGRLVEPRS